MPRIPRITTDIFAKRERISLGRAIAEILRDNTGIKCPHGCNGCSARWWGLVSHLMDMHKYPKKQAEKTARKIFHGESVMKVEKRYK